MLFRALLDNLTDASLVFAVAFGTFRIRRNSSHPIVKTAFPAVGPILEAARDSGDQNLAAAAQNVGMIGAKLDKETQTAISNALTNPAQGVRDAVQTHIKAANGIVDAFHASARYAERTVSGYRAY
jgi:hypothetical protein